MYMYMLCTCIQAIGCCVHSSAHRLHEVAKRRLDAAGSHRVDTVTSRVDVVLSVGADGFQSVEVRNGCSTINTTYLTLYDYRM